ncbi:MAG: S-layer homology domain-containing protein [Andreesenia angusta]|nr:S-layer homology domain-containing protein [Andreesenia angusta]
MKRLRAIGMCITTILLTSSIALAIEFNDIEKHWGREVIQKLASEEIINGYLDGSFKPDNKITREEVATLIYKTMKKYDQIEEYSGKNLFDDIEKRYSEEYINTLANMNIIKGYEDGDFRPETNISREEFATLIYRYAKKEGVLNESKKGNLSDSDEISTWAKTPVAVMIGNDLIKGMSDGSFKPKNLLTRAEAAQLLFNIKGLFEEEKPNKRIMKTTKDVILLEKPEKNSEPISKNSELKKDTEVIVLKEEGEYLLIKPISIEDAESGYLKKENLVYKDNGKPYGYYDQKKMVVKERVELRLEPLDTAGLIGKNNVLEPGSEVIILGEATYYYLVKPLGIDNPYVGYGIKTAFENTKDEEIDDDKKEGILVSNKEVHLKLQPTEDSELISRNNILPKGMKFKLEGEATEYYLVRPIGISDAQRGYILKDDLDRIENE